MTDVVAAAGQSTITTPTTLNDASTKRRRGGSLGIGGWICIGWLAFVAGAAILAPVLPIEDPLRPDFRTLPNAGIGTEGHPLGVDQPGFDILSRLVWGGRVSLVVAIGVLAIGMVIGGAIGLVAGFVRGRLETVLMAAVDIFLAFPALLLLIAIVAFLGNEVLNIVLGISLVSIPAFARISRATTLTFARREFVLAAEAAGASRFRILVREVLPNVILPLLAFGLLVVAIAIVAEGSLAFLGLTDPDNISWGAMINDGRNALVNEKIAHTTMLPAAWLFFTVLSVNFLGDRFRSAFDVKDAAL